MYLDISDIVSTYLMLKVDFPSNVDERFLGTFTGGNVNEGTKLVALLYQYVQSYGRDLSKAKYKKY